MSAMDVDSKEAADWTDLMRRNSAMENALTTIAAFPVTDPKNMDAINMAKIAAESLGLRYVSEDELLAALQADQ